MKNTKRYPLPQWLLLPLLTCSSLVLAQEQFGSSMIENAPLTLEDDRSDQEGGLVRVATPDVNAQARMLANEPDGLLNESAPAAVLGGSKSYMGGNTRIGVGFDSKFKGRVDATHVFSDQKNAVTSGEGWLGVNPKAKENEKKLTGAGAKLNHHWVQENSTGGAARVHKVFGAYDQNQYSDKKVTVGYGQETQNLFWSGHASFAKGDERLIATDKYVGPIVEKPYDYGVGARVGKFLPNQLMQIQGGVDLEFAKEASAGEKSAAQVTLTGGVEKFFADSPHSIAANLEFLGKSGGIEPEKKNETRGSLNYRYEFGGAGLYAPNQEYRRVRVEIPGEVKVVRTPPKTERKMIKNTMELEADTFFEQGRSVLLPEAKQRLMSVINRIRQGGAEGSIRITGNTCDLGSDEENQLLSERRADAVRDFFVASGIQEDALLSEGMGESNPKYPNQPQTRHRNRRVDVEFITYQTDYKEVVVDGGSTRTMRTAPTVTWRQEVINTPPKWVERALRNTIQHKRSIDTYMTGKGGGTVNAPQEGKLLASRSDSYHFYSNSIGTVQKLTVLSNDNYYAGTQIQIVSNPNNLKLSVSGGVINYTPSAAGDYSFTYRLVSPDGTVTDPTTVTIKVDSCESSVKCSNIKVVNDTYSVTINDTTTKILQVLTNDEGNDLKIISVSTPKYGTAKISKDGKSIEYTLRYGYCTDHEFTYIVQDKDGKTAQATVTIKVNN